MGSAIGDATGTFCLKWNDYASNISIAFRDLRAHNDFFDVTLLTKDGSVQAHKVILSACSDFFRDAFKRMQPPRSGVLPMSIFLRGVSLLELQSIIEFIYQGQVNVAQDGLNEFLAVAEELQVKGLTNKDDSENPLSPPPLAASAPKTSFVKSAYLSPSQVATGAVKRSITPSTSKGLNSVKRVKSEERISLNPEDLGASSSGHVDPLIILDGSEDPDPIADEDYDGYDGYYGEEDADVGDEAMASDHGGQSESSQDNYSNFLTKKNGKLQCMLCDTSFSHYSSGLTHMKEKHMDPNDAVYTCHICFATFKVKRYLNVHMGRIHKITSKMLKLLK